MSRFHFYLPIPLSLSFLQLLPSAALAQMRPVDLPGLPNSTSPSPINVSPPQPLGSYILGPLDTVKIDVFNVPELSGNQTVGPDGTINISLIGAVTVEGLTLEEASRLLEEKLAPFLVRKIVNVALIEARPLNIVLSGEVNRPGTRLLAYSRSTATGRDAQSPTITRALEVANGITQQADVSNIVISRRDRGGQRRLINVNLLALLREGDLSQDVKLLDGDSIFVPKLSDSTASQPRQVNSATFASDSFTIRVTLVGEVNKTGPQVLSYVRNSQGGTNAAGQLSEPPTLTRAIATAGGITERADIRNVQVSRLESDGRRTVFRGNLWNLIEKADFKQDIALADGDQIIVPQATRLNPAEYDKIAKATFSPAEITVQVLGEAVRPGPLKMRPNSPFTEAIASAGGLTNSADWRTVELYRINPDGTVTRKKLVADLGLPPNDVNNPGLRDRDVIVIRPSLGASVVNSVTTFLGNVVTPFGLINSLFNTGTGR